VSQVQVPTICVTLAFAGRSLHFNKIKHNVYCNAHIKSYFTLIGILLHEVESSGTRGYQSRCYCNSSKVIAMLIQEITATTGTITLSLTEPAMLNLQDQYPTVWSVYTLAHVRQSRG
jgi:hypothetical protein